MNLIYRKQEIELLRRQLWLSRNKRGRLSHIAGRRGSGKTALAAAAMEGEDFLYFRLGGKNESLQLEEFAAQIRRVLGLYVPATAKDLTSLVCFLMDRSFRSPFTLVLDDFDDYYKSRSDEAQALRRKWDETRDDGRLNLVLITGNKAVSRELFYNHGSPFLNVIDADIELDFFTIAQLKTLLANNGASPAPEDILTFYAVTGGAPELVGRLLSAGCLTREKIFDMFFCENSSLIYAGERMLSGVLGRNRDVYMSILQLIASGSRTLAEIESHLGGATVGGHLAKLETDYELVTKKRPLLAGESSRNVVRYEITDPFLLFWLRYVERYRSLVDTFAFGRLRQRAEEDYPQFSKQLLRRYFRQRFAEETPGSRVGGDWKTGESSEIDIIVQSPSSRKIIVAAVEKRAEDFEKEAFLARVAALRNGPLKGSSIDTRLFTEADV